MKKTDLKNTIKEEIKKILSEERDPQQMALIRGALAQIKEAGDSALNSMINNLSADEAQQLNLLIAKGIGKTFPRISPDSPSSDPRLTPGTTD
jgi:predicted component of type VI protein secretion system